MGDVKERPLCAVENKETEKKRLEYMKNSFMAYLQTEVFYRNNVNVLQEIYEHIMPASNEEIVAKHKSHTNKYLGKNMNEILYLDMIAILGEKIVQERKLCEWFIEKIRCLYPDDFEFVVDYAQMNCKNITYEEYERLSMEYGKRLSGCKAQDEAKRQFLTFVYSYYANIEDLDINETRGDDWYASYLVGECHYERGIQSINEKITAKMDWTDDFSKSIVLEKYVKKQIVLLAKHKGVEVEDLKFLIEQRVSDNDMLYLAFIIVEKYGIRHNWIFDIIQTWSVEKLVGRMEAYYKHQLFYYWATHVDEVDTITKLDITRHMPQRNYEHDFEIISNSVVIDVMAELYANLTKEFYKNFSFEKITNKSLSERYENKILEYESVVERKNRQIKNIQDENFRMKVLLDKKHFAEGQQEYIKELEVAIDEKEAEIERLCQQSTQKDAYIELLSKEDKEERQEYDLLYLQSKRYLFVGWETKLQQELKKIFPNSIFMTSNTTNIEGIRVDAVVYLTKSMKHSMYYKVASSKLVKTVPVVNYNGKRCEGVYGEMYVVLADYYKDNNPKTA